MCTAMVIPTGFSADAIGGGSARTSLVEWVTPNVWHSPAR